MNHGRDKLPWSQEVWDRIDQAVRDECERIKVTSKFLPHYRPSSPGELTAPSEGIETDGRAFFTDEAAIVPLTEIWVEFTLTPQQVAGKEELGTAVTLATRAANLVSQAVDVTVLGGREAMLQHPVFQNNTIHVRSGPADIGLLQGPERGNPEDPDVQIVRVLPLDPHENPPRYGENTFAAVEEAYRRLQRGTGLSQSHYGPYALVLPTDPYTDTYAPLSATLLMPGARILKLVDWFQGTNSLPPCTGVLVSLGSGAMDLVVGMEATTSFLQEEPDGTHRFRVYERFALRLRDPSSLMRLEFEPPAHTGNGKTETYGTETHRI